MREDIFSHNNLTNNRWKPEAMKITKLNINFNLEQLFLGKYQTEQEI